MVLVHPFRDAELVRVQRELSAARGNETPGAGKEHDHLAAEDLADVAHRDRQELVHAARARQLSTHGVERRRPLLALSGRHRLHADPRRQTAGHEPDEQHDREGEQVADVGDREREDRGYEEEVERGDAQDGGHQRGPSTVARRDDDDPEQIHHDEVGELEERERQPRDSARQRHDGQRPDVGRPFGRNRTPPDEHR